MPEREFAVRPLGDEQVPDAVEPGHRHAESRLLGGEESEAGGDVRPGAALRTHRFGENTEARLFVFVERDGELHGCVVVGDIGRAGRRSRQRTGSGRPEQIGQ